MSGTAPPVLYAFEGGVARVTIHWPDARNAQSREVMEGLLDANEGVTAFLEKRDAARKGR